MINQKDYYKTDSFLLASYLVAKGIELADLEPSNSGSEKFIFCFRASKNLHLLIDEYFTLKASIRPQDFANAQKTLKSIIHSKKESF